MPFTDYGPGDEITWGPCTGHPHDPRTPEPPDDYLGAWEAAQMAADQICSTAADVADWLAKETDNPAGWEPVETMRVDEADLQDAPVHVLLAVIVTGTDRQAGLARMFLQDRFKAARVREIRDRTNDLLLEANGRPDDDEL